MNKYSGSIASLVSSFLGNRALIARMARREVIARYRGSLMGLAWSFFYPILLLVVYTFVFTVVFEARWGENRFATGGGQSPAIMIFAGMIVHGLFSECFVRSPVLITSNVNFVKRVVFPLEILPWISIGAALFHAAISFLVLLMAQIFVADYIPWTVVLLPVVLVPLVMLTMGCCWFFAASGVYFRDLSQVSGLISTVLLFLSPVFYPLSAIPEAYRSWFFLNPLTYVIEVVRELMVFGVTPALPPLLLFYLISGAISVLGFAWFQSVRRGFADVL